MEKYGAQVYRYASVCLAAIKSNQSRNSLARLFGKLVMKYEPHGNAGDGRVETGKTKYGIIEGLKKLNHKSRHYGYLAELEAAGLLTLEADTVILHVEPSLIPKQRKTFQSRILVSSLPTSEPRQPAETVPVVEKSEPIIDHRYIASMVDTIRESLCAELRQAKASKEEWDCLPLYNQYARELCTKLYLCDSLKPEKIDKIVSKIRSGEYENIFC